MKAENPNIVFIVLDTVRASNLSLFGYDRNTTPFLKKFADESIHFQRAYSPAPWTTPSHASMFTGTYVATHLTDRSNKRLTPDLSTLPELMNDAGYKTVGFSNNAHLSSDFDFDRGFEDFVFNGESYNEPFDGGVPVSRVRANTGNGSFYRQAFNSIRFVRDRPESLVRTSCNWIYRKLSEMGYISNVDRGAATTNNFVDEYLQRKGDKPFFMFLNYMEAHAPYQSPDEYLHRYVDSPSVSEWESVADYLDQQVAEKSQKVGDLQDQYDGCIRYLDSKISELIEIFKMHDCFDESLIIITSDHGEAFGEHGLYEHKGGLYDELTHVPLLINTPSQRTSTIEKPVSCRWLFPTLLAEADIKIPDYSESTNLLSNDSNSVVIESEGIPYDESIDEMKIQPHFCDRHQGLIKDGKKLIQYDWDNEIELYDIGNETDDMRNKYPDKVQKMVDELDRTLDENKRNGRSDKDEKISISGDTLDHLRELGYR